MIGPGEGKPGVAGKMYDEPEDGQTMRGNR